MALQETLDLDIAAALRGVDSIDDALTQLTSRFRVGLADALDVLRTPAEVAVDTTALTSAVSDAIAGADTTVTLDGLDATAASVTDAIDAGVTAADTAVTVTADGLPAVTADVTDAVQVADTTVTVDADTAPAVAALNDLGQAGDVGADAVDKVTSSTSRLDVAAAFAAGDLTDLTETLPESGALTAVAGGLAAVAVAATASFHAADEAQIADARLADTFGNLADSVQDINVGGLTGDLTELAEQAGSSDEALKLSIARLAELGRSGGASDENIVQVSQDIAALALRLSVANPTLGDAGDIAGRLTTAFARGGRALAPFGLALTSTEINARALRDTGKSTVDELTLFDKSAAGAAIAVGQLGDQLGPDFQRGTEQTVIGLRSVKEEFGNALEEIGKPLLAPVLEELREGKPALIDLATLFGDLAVDVLPLATSLIGAVTPAVHGTLIVVEALTPAVEVFVDAVDAIPTPVLAAVGVFLALRAAGQKVSPVISAVQTAITGLATSSAAGGSAIAGIGSAFAGLLNPATLALAAVAAGVTILAAHSAAAKKDREEVRALSDEIGKQEQTFADLAETQLTARLRARNQIDDLNRIGLTTAQVTKLVLEGADGYQAFISALSEGGEVTPKVAEGLIRGAAAGRTLNESLGDLDTAGVSLGNSNIGLVHSFVNVQQQTQKAAQEQLALQVASGKLSQSQVDLAFSQNRLIGGGTDYTKVLNDLLPVQVKLADGTTAYGTAADQAATLAESYTTQIEAIRNGTDAVATAQAKAGPGLAGVVQQFRDGTLTGAEFATVLANTGLSAEDLDAVLQAAQDEVGQFVDAFVQGIPKITGASATLADDHSLAKFLDDLHQKTLDEAAFVSNIAILESRGASALAETFAQAGVAAATEAGKAARLGDDALAKREAQRDRDLRINADTVKAAEDLGTDLFNTHQNTVNHLGSVKPPDLTKPILHAIGNADSALQHAAHDLEVSGRHLGEAIGAGLDQSQPAIFRAAERAARAAKAGFAQELQISSPSKVFFGYGVNAGSAAASGLDSTAGQLEAASSRLAQRMVLNVPGAQTTNTGVTNPAVAVSAGAVPGANGVRDIIVNEVANDPVATAQAVDAMLGARAAR